ncbi:hypothetical protein GGP68_003481 [Salinibacter ruber]|nr:hypothetical protein [Salinibacter ruber]
MLQGWKRAFLREPAGTLVSGGLEGVSFGDGLVEPGAGLADRLLGGPLAVKLEISLDPSARESGQKLGDAAGPDADVGELFG